MLTARIALDEVVDENGPLLVIPGSHRDVSAEELPTALELEPRTRPIHMRAGDVLLIRPLVVHRSGPSRPGTIRHRRTLHFEFAAEETLPAGLAWHRFEGMTA
jgi:ectoine hydroxylase-related dioxygenase (phytanoyl-CoA dioxygenase family)